MTNLVSKFIKLVQNDNNITMPILTFWLIWTAMIYGIKMLLVMKKLPSWMNSVLPMDVTANMPSEFSKSSNALQNQRKKREVNQPVIRMRLSVNPLRKSGLPQICPAQNASRSSCSCGFQDMFNSSTNSSRRLPMPC